MICESQNIENVELAMTSPCCRGYFNQQFETTSPNKQRQIDLLLRLTSLSIP